MDRYRDRRSPERGRYSRDGPPVDSYVPGGARAGRPRSRSPPGNYRRRSRTPPRADTWTPRYRDMPDSYAPPRREFGRDERYGGRPRSPPPGVKRGRDFSPPPAKRERLAAADSGYGRPRSPPRRGYSPPPNRNSYRPRSRSPPRRNDDQYGAPAFRRRSPSPRSGAQSGATSRRSSPRSYGRRPVDDYNVLDTRPLPSAHTPDQRQEFDDRRRPPPTPQDYEEPSNGDYFDREPLPRLDTEYRDRVPPSGPASARMKDQSPGSANTNTTPVSLSAHNRPSSSSIPPSGPSSYPPPRGGYNAGPPFRGRGGPPRDPIRGRGGWGPPPSARGRGDYRDDYHRGPSRFEARRPERANAFAGGNSTSRTVPQSVRFDVNGALADLPKIKDHGERLPPLYDGSKAEKLEEEAARLRKLIDEKDVRKRQISREWDAIDRERHEAELRGNLAEDRLRELVGEGGGVAF